MPLKPNFDSFAEYSESDHAIQPPCVAVFRQGVKTLVYMCDRHNANRSYDMIDWVFDQSSLSRADIFLVEKENDYTGEIGGV